LYDLGVPHQDFLTAGKYEYFKVYASGSFDELIVTVTALGRSDPDLYMSTTVSRPDSDSFTWAAMLVGTDTISVPRTDVNFCMCLWMDVFMDEWIDIWLFSVFLLLLYSVPYAAMVQARNVGTTSQCTVSPTPALPWWLTTARL
jgi:hypothetical protein